MAAFCVRIRWQAPAEFRMTYVWSTTRHRRRTREPAVVRLRRDIAEAARGHVGIRISRKDDALMTVKYGDSHDQLTAGIVARNSGIPWLEQDRDVLSWFRSQTTASNVVDYGCGVGRHEAQLSGLWSTVVAYDPDDARIERCRDVCASLPNVFSTPIFGPPTEQGEGEGSDVICSHVLQHVRSSKLRPVIRELVATAGSSGKILTFVSAREGSSRYFTLSDSGVAQRVHRADFDAAIDDGRAAAAHLDVDRIASIFSESGRPARMVWRHREFHYPESSAGVEVSARGEDWCLLA